MRGFREVERNFSNVGVMKKEVTPVMTIKPETDITVEECQSFWNNFFKNLSVESLPDEIIGKVDNEVDSLPDEII